MEPIWRRRFSPSIVEVDIGSAHFRFFIASPLSASWYDPPQPHALTEYHWVLAHVPLRGARVIDAGAHHGHYALLLACQPNRPDVITAVEASPSNCAVLDANAALNGVSLRIVQAAVAERTGSASFLDRGNGRLVPGVGRTVSTLPLADIDPRATVVKLDIEGTEFAILPEQAATLPDVHSWIIEYHARHGDSDASVQAWQSMGYTASFVDKAHNQVVPYRAGALGRQSTTVFLQR
jgi:FkbM family methyltransferase